MSKAIKQMEMDALKKRFEGVREYVFLSVNKLDAQADWSLRQKIDAATTAVDKFKACAKWVASATATQPFAASPISVRTAAVLLPLRNTFVAPGLREPKVRGS